ncbi:AAA family ATPase [Saccharopolyspora gloriosae]|uniref:ATP-binding protein n=1 Tax=Saccharopolyspora gloriosae TaxID=455344 RepID=UPI001FB661CF|nr:AAA family ATPase [Saccharopolyspora gloriosae]
MQEIIGRDAELAQVRRAARETGQVLIVTGDPGMGKTTLLDAAAEPDALRATGSETETNLAFAGLHQLLAPVLRRAEGRPEAARLFAAFGVDEDPVEPDVMRLGLAVLSLLSDTGGLLIVDDAQWLDRASLDVLAFLARRIDAEPLSLLIGAREDQPLPGMDRLPTLRLEPLGDLDANRVLDARPQPPTGARRLRVLAEAGGNPLALTELAAVPEESGPGPSATTERLEKIFAARAQELPEHSRELLLVLAAADTADPVRPPGAGWEAAERAGLVRWTGSRFRFRHPLVRSALYHSAPFEQRRRAHLRLAAATEEPDRHAWHLAAAAGEPDEDVAAALEATAERARRRGGYAAAATTLERAAELSPDRAERARRLVLAANSALFTAQAGWVEDLAARVVGLTDDPELLAIAALRTGQALTVTTRHAAAFTQLFRTATALARRDPGTALDVLATAAVVAYYSAEPGRRDAVLAALPEIPGEQNPVTRAWVSAVADPVGSRAEVLPLLPALSSAESGPGHSVAVATIAWLLDETPLAVRLFEQAFERWRVRGPLPEGLGCAQGWALFESGAWTQVRAIAGDSLNNGARAELPHVMAGSKTMDGAVLALRGESARAAELATEALSMVDPAASRMVAVRARYVLGMVAAGAGDHATAYAQFRRMFTADGEFEHYHQSAVALPELAAAAARLGTPHDAERIVRAAAHRLDDGASVRLRALLDHARAMLAADPEPLFAAALADPRTEQWPFERARTLLHQAEWLRRARRIAESRAPLEAALETFRRLGAAPWTARAEAELRASGGADPGTAAPDVLDELSPQQQEIVRLAARGLTNREIGDRLFLSPRTVGSHLYRSFPKLGVSNRNQLRDLLEPAATVPPE